MNDIRKLDFDDLYILEQLYTGKKLTSIAKSLNISQPAVSQRLRKIEEVFKYQVISYEGRKIRLTYDGMDLAQRAISALNFIRDGEGQTVRNKVLNIGTRPEVGMSWLGKALFALRTTHPEIGFHVHIASGHENLQRLGTGALDAILTSAPLTVKDFRSIELAKEEYVLIASSKISAKIKNHGDLQNHVLIEYDRSFPFQNYLATSDREQMQFRDVWFLGSTVLMTEAILEGHGVGVVPLYLARDALKRKDVRRLNFCKEIGSDNFRFIMRADPQVEESLSLLAKLMIEDGLR
jgi:DNA-binding transcriptional LysR family regulator